MNLGGTQTFRPQQHTLLLQLSHSSWLFCFFQSFFFFLLQVSTQISSSSEILSSAMSSLLISPLKVFFISVIVFLISKHFFWVLSQNFHLSVYNAQLFLHVIYFTHSSLSMVIILILNSLSNNSKIPAIDGSNSDTWYVSSKYVFWFLVYLVIFS